ncbi:MAG: beta-ketoacyl-ACP synthase II [Chloroherpetonaceae bacterium]|nr:beta-ketoacyl-ACP synthase II [Chthonomonadaceae bacterium]MDW8209212.1 beta-ketoacyl-ACP synthase II [Chloroherpetonaceae bacterium]
MALAQTTTCHTDSLPARRVVVTGIGAITPIGSGPEGLWSGVLQERSAVQRITRFDPTPFSCHIAAQVNDFDPADYLDQRTRRRLDPCSQYAVVACLQAVRDAGIDLSTEDRSRIGVCLGSALGGAGWAEGQHAAFLDRGPRAVSPVLALQMFVGAGACNASILLGLTGFSSSNADSCASGAIAIGNAWHAIRRKDADVMLAGGAEAPLAPLCFGAFTFIGALSRRNAEPERACRPFDRDRDGFVMGEGAAVLLLEERERALRRGARIYAELCGFAATMDAHHMTMPRPDAGSAARCIRLALQSAQVAPEELDYVNAHGSSTRLNDVTETYALKRALGEEVARNVPVSSTKAMHGHALGATGAMEAAICCLALHHGWIPPTVNLDHPDPECDLDCVPHRGRSAQLRTVLSNSFGFGGINAALVFRSATP